MAFLSPYEQQNLCGEVTIPGKKDVVNTSLTIKSEPKNQIDKVDTSKPATSSSSITPQSKGEEAAIKGIRADPEFKRQVENLKIIKELEIVTGARQQMERVLDGTVDAAVTAQTIVSKLQRTHQILISCTTIFNDEDGEWKGKGLAHAMLRNWTDWTRKERVNFACKFSAYAPGYWGMKDVEQQWRGLLMILEPEISEVQPLYRPIDSRLKDESATCKLPTFCSNIRIQFTV